MLRMKRSKSAVRLCWKICCLLFITIASATTAAAETTTAARTSSADSSETTTPNNNNGNNGRRSPGREEDCTDLARDEETLMVFSTLGGGLTAIDPITSEIRWTIADDPPIKAEQQQNVQVPQYLPDPRDGSIYQLGNMGSLKKLPYTIPELVASAPCRSSDGILYSGKKSDTWFIVDPKTGRREKVMGFGGSKVQDAGGGGGGDVGGGGGDKIGWATSRAIYLGRTQYTVMMYDSLSHDKNAKPWNITFYDYSAHTMTPSISKEYEYLHLTTTTNGNIVTLDRKNGKFLWKHDLTSPVVAAFLLGSEGLLSVPFTTVSDEAFTALVEESNGGNVNTVKLFHSLYVGEHNHGLYALPSLVDKQTPRIATTPPIKLLDGPSSHSSSEHGGGGTSDPQTVYIEDVIQKNSGILLGHYSLPPDGQLLISPGAGKPTQPDEGKRDLAALTAKLALPANMAQLNVAGNGFTLSTLTSSAAADSADKGVQTDTPIVEITIEPSSQSTAFNRTKKIILANSGRIQEFINEWFMEHPSGKVHQILIVMVLAMVAMFWYLCSTMRELKSQSSESGSKTYGSSGGGSGGGPDGAGAGDSRSSTGSNASASSQDLIDLGDGQVRVGKISFSTSEVLGKGCEGTFVFRGTFEERSVAVKRLLPECFTFADREVALLRESDAHENVVRYFCTEQDRQFRYIAVELCAATLQDYTEGSQGAALRRQISPWEVLRQAAAGLNHLHSLNIVHRDIKPQNVLLSLPDVRGLVRVMISDFGLCKKLNFGKTSFSRRSGVTGTDGWIAPEMIHGQRTTTSVDIFSLGCVYYYVLTGGHHAFGDALKRQANIRANECDLSQLKEVADGDQEKPFGTMILAEQLVADMINEEPHKRPTAQYIGNHPIFWPEQKILAFLQDVSDRVEKLQFHVEPLRSLEKNGQLVVINDWNLHLDPLITDDLRKYRGYMGASVRDLLRALRNKKHHYHELTPQVQGILGALPHEFTRYWIRKFPHLISHTYHAFSICAAEPLFQPYYNDGYCFTRPAYFEAEYELYPSVLLTDPKPLLKQSAGPASPKRPGTARGTPERNTTNPQWQQQFPKTRKGAYNFRKPSLAPEYGDGPPFNVGLQRNLPDSAVPSADDAITAAAATVVDGSDRVETTEDNEAQRHDVFANFKFRRHQNRINNYNKEKNIQWTLPNAAKGADE